MTERPDPADPALYARGEHVEPWRDARARAPVDWAESDRCGPFWSVTGYAPARQVLERPELFTSIHGMRLDGEPAAVAAAAGRMMIVSDGAAHRRIRSAHAAWFQGAALIRARTLLPGALAAELDTIIDGRPTDVVGSLATALPTWVIGDMLGVDPADAQHLAALAAAAFAETAAPSEPAMARHAAARRAASAQIFAFFADLVERRRERPGPDIVSALVAGGPDGLSDDEILLNCDGLVNGGLGTTRHAVSGAILAFAEHPDQLERLRATPRLIGPAVEEILRWASPPRHVLRTASADTRLGSADIRAGDRVVVWIPSANRDAAVFPDPDAFVLDRRPNAHLSLGAGPHYCIGAALARLELRTLLTALAERVQRIELSGAVVPSASTFLNGYDSLEVTLVPATRRQVRP